MVTKFRTQGSLEGKDKRITDIINKWYYKAIRSIQTTSTIARDQRRGIDTPAHFVTLIERMKSFNSNPGQNTNAGELSIKEVLCKLQNGIDEASPEDSSKIMEQAAALARLGLQGGHKIKRALIYLITKIALSTRTKVPMMDIIVTLMTAMIHSEGAHRIESAVRTSFDSIVRRQWSIRRGHHFEGREGIQDTGFV